MTLVIIIGPHAYNTALGLSEHVAQLNPNRTLELCRITMLVATIRSEAKSEAEALLRLALMNLPHEES